MIVNFSDELDVQIVRLVFLEGFVEDDGVLLVIPVVVLAGDLEGFIVDESGQDDRRFVNVEVLGVEDDPVRVFGDIE